MLSQNGKIIYAQFPTRDRLPVPKGFVNPRGVATLPRKGVFAMRLLSKRQLKEVVLYSPQHIQRLENAGKFPKRVRLGQNRVGWLEDEVYDWLQERIDAREPTDTSP